MYFEMGENMKSFFSTVNVISPSHDICFCNMFKWTQSVKNKAKDYWYLHMKVLWLPHGKETNQQNLSSTHSCVWLFMPSRCTVWKKAAMTLDTGISASNIIYLIIIYCTEFIERMLSISDSNSKMHLSELLQLVPLSGVWFDLYFGDMPHCKLTLRTKHKLVPIKNECQSLIIKATLGAETHCTEKSLFKVFKMTGFYSDIVAFGCMSSNHFWGETWKWYHISLKNNGNLQFSPTMRSVHSRNLCKTL